MRGLIEAHFRKFPSGQRTCAEMKIQRTVLCALFAALFTGSSMGQERSAVSAKDLTPAILALRDPPPSTSPSPHSPSLRPRKDRLVRVSQFRSEEHTSELQSL